MVRVLTGMGGGAEIKRGNVSSGRIGRYVICGYRRWKK